MNRHQHNGEGERTVSSPEPFGLFYTWWRDDPLPELPELPGLTIKPVDDDRAGEAGIELSPEEIPSRIAQGHHLYVAHLDGELAGWGWSATSTASASRPRTSAASDDGCGLPARRRN